MRRVLQRRAADRRQQAAGDVVDEALVRVAIGRLDDDDERRTAPYPAELVLEGLEARAVAREQGMEIGPMSGEANVVYWLQKRGLPTEPPLVLSFSSVKPRA